MAEALVSSLDKVCVYESQRKKERVRLSALYKELVLLMKSPWQMGLILEVSHNHRDLQLAREHTHTLFLPLVKYAPDSLSLFLALFTLCFSFFSCLPLFILFSVLVFYS